MKKLALVLLLTLASCAAHGKPALQRFDALKPQMRLFSSTTRAIQADVTRINTGMRKDNVAAIRRSVVMLRREARRLARTSTFLSARLKKLSKGQRGVVLRYFALLARALDHSRREGHILERAGALIHQDPLLESWSLHTVPRLDSQARHQASLVLLYLHLAGTVQQRHAAAFRYFPAR